MRSAVCLGIFVAAVVAFACGVLKGGVEVEAVAQIGRRNVEREAAAVDRVVGLLGEERFVRRPVEPVAAAAEFADVVILGRQARVGARAEERACPHGLRIQHRQLGESVAVAVVARAVAALTVDAEARLAVVAHERGVERGAVVVGAAAAQRHERVGDLCRIVERIARDDVDRAADGRRPEKSGTASAQHLDPLDHAGRNLFEPVDAREGREDGVGVDEYLGVMAVEPVDADLREAAVLAVVLGADAGLETQSLSQTDRIGLLEQVGSEDADQRRSFAAQRGAAAGRDHHVVHRNAALGDFEVELLRFASAEDDLFLLGRITDLAGFDDVFAFGQIVEKIVSRGVGRDAVGGAVDRNGRKGEVFAGPAVDDMTEKIGVRGAFGGVVRLRDAGEAHEKCGRYDAFHGFENGLVPTGTHGKAPPDGGIREKTEEWGKRRIVRRPRAERAAIGAGGLRRAWRRSEAEHGCRAA